MKKGIILFICILALNFAPVIEGYWRLLLTVPASVIAGFIAGILND